MRYIKHDVGETVSVNGIIKAVRISEDGKVVYLVETEVAENSYDGSGQFAITEENTDYAVETYKAEIAALKTQLKAAETDRYNLLKRLLEANSEPSEGIKGDSHHPTKNTYADDWRLP